MAPLIDQETGIRGYAVSGRPADLGPYQEAIARENAVDRRDGSRCSSTVPRSAASCGASASRSNDGAPRSPSRSSRAVGTGGPDAATALITDEARQRFDTSARARWPNCRANARAARRGGRRRPAHQQHGLVLLLIARRSSCCSPAQPARPAAPDGDRAGDRAWPARSVRWPAATTTGTSPVRLAGADPARRRRRRDAPADRRRPGRGPRGRGADRVGQRASCSSRPRS